VLVYKNGSKSDPFHYIFSSFGWLTDYDPPSEFPFFINLEPTNICQLDCLFCSRQLSKRPLGYLDLKMAEDIFREAKNHEGTAIRFTGWGEPLLHPEIGSLASLVKENGLGLKIYTNGLALTPELMDIFIDIGLDDLQFSLQGLTPMQYEFNRLKADYKTLEKSIIMASAKRGARNKPFLSILTSVLADELAAAEPNLFIQKWLKYVDKVAVDFTNLNFVSGVQRVKPYLSYQSSNLIRGRCVDVFLALEIKYDGSIQICGQDAQGTESHTLGQFGSMTLAEAWLGKKMENQRNMVGRNLFHHLSKICSNCYHNTTKYDLFKKESNLKKLKEV